MNMDILWAPAIYEHKAALIGRSPIDVANSSQLLAEAVLKEYQTYQADYMTVGLDVYNIEAEALGAALMVPGENECPDIDGKLYDLDSLPEPLVVPDMASGRFPLLIDAGQKVIAAIGDKTRIRIAASGPVTLASKLAGLEGIIMSLYSGDGQAAKLLQFAADVAEAWCRHIRDNDLEAILFDSMAAPPMFSPSMFEQHLLPLYRRLMSILESTGQLERELVIGGETAAVAHLQKSSGATILLCDYAADAAAFAANLGEALNLSVRRNINPTLLSEGGTPKLAETFVGDLSNFSNPIAGTGILPYAFEPEDYLEFKSLVASL